MSAPAAAREQLGGGSVIGDRIPQDDAAWGEFWDDFDRECAELAHELGDDVELVKRSMLQGLFAYLVATLRQGSG